MSRRLVRLVGAGVVVLAASALAAYPARAADPVRNIVAAPTIRGSVCDTAPTSAACRTRIVSALDHARSVEHLPHYALPTRFAWLTPREKLLVLLDQDRTARGLSREDRFLRRRLRIFDFEVYAGSRRERGEEPVRVLAQAGQPGLRFASDL